MGLGAFPASDPQWLGMLGMHGTYEANMAMHDCDVMVAVGARFDDRVTGRIDAFSPGSKKIHIDIDPSSINKNVRVDMPHRRRRRPTCSRTCCASGSRGSRSSTRPALKTWWEQIDQWRAQNSLCLQAGRATSSCRNTRSSGSTR